jgi:hypothetical protein
MPAGHTEKMMAYMGRHAHRGHPRSRETIAAAISGEPRREAQEGFAWIGKGKTGSISRGLVQL